MKYQYFDTTKITNLEELKKAFKTLAFKLHPDKGGDTEAFKALNNEYTKLFELYKNNSTNKQEKAENVNTFKNIINELIRFDNINIEVVGYWLWVSGKGTFSIKQELKDLNFWYSSKHKCYMYNGQNKIKGCRTKATTGEIKYKYGCTVVKNDDDNNKPPKRLQ